MLRALLLTGICAASLDAATVALAEGGVIEDPVLSFDVAGRSVTLGDTSRSIPVADLRWLAFGAERRNEDQAEDGWLAVVLADGSWLPGRLGAARKDDTVALSSPLLTGELGLEKIRATGDPAWIDRVLGSATDRVLTSGGEVEGQIQGISEGKLLILTALAPEPLKVPMDDLLGFVLAGAQEPAAGQSGLSLIVTGMPGRPPVRLRWGWPLALALDPAVTIDSLEDLGRIEVRGGRVVPLSGLTPSAVQETGAFGKVWPHRRDQGLDGAPLRLGRVPQDHGLVIHSDATLSWDLAGAYDRFTALVGLDSPVAQVGDCAVRILVDGAVVWERASVRGDAALPVDLPLTGAKLLTVEVRQGARFDIGDHLVLGEAILVTARTAAP